LGIDNGGEICLEEFGGLFKENNIEIHKKTPCSPQHNGVIKHMKKTNKPKYL
jgi:hypothetical protein